MQGELVTDRIDQERGRLRPVVVTAADARAAAFRGLIEAELDRAYRLATVILGDRYDAEDAVHDAAEAAWRRWSDLRDEQRFQAWFGKIVVNACRDRLRRRRRRRLVEIPRLVLDKEHPMAPDAADALALRDVLRRAFDALSPEERIVVVLRYEADLTMPRVAELAGIPEGTAKSRLHHALRKLRAVIGEEEP
jgi:RNA polymerase sigma-70 factor (ECF subfamily)